MPERLLAPIDPRPAISTCSGCRAVAPDNVCAGHLPDYDRWMHWQMFEADFNTRLDALGEALDLVQEELRDKQKLLDHAMREGIMWHELATAWERRACAAEATLAPALQAIYGSLRGSPARRAARALKQALRHAAPQRAPGRRQSSAAVVVRRG
jgi:hypothetical protein